MSFAGQQTQQAAPACDVVIDTNVLLDWLVFGDATVTPLVRALDERRWRWIATPAMLAELDEVMLRMGRRTELALTSIDLHCHRVPAPLPRPRRTALLCRDPDDQMFIDLAVEYGASRLFTRDKALLRLARALEPLGVRVCRPAEFDWPHE